MDKKHGIAGQSRPCRSKKRKFRGNKYTAETNTQFTSTSATKLSNTQELSVSVDPTFQYCIIQFTVFTYLQQILKCKKCDKDVKFSKSDERGLGFKLCITCQCSDNFYHSSPMINRAYDINRRFVYAMRLVGVGISGIRSFCGFMDLTAFFSNNNYYGCVDNIKDAVDAVLKIVLNKAANEEKGKKKEAGNIENHFTVSGDGSWAKRGFSSLLGIVSLVGKYSNKILDVIVKSSFCSLCSHWAGKKNTIEYEAFFNDHEENCQANHDGSAGKMEVDGMVEMFKRSEDLHDAKYLKYIGDGDTKTFKAIVDLQPYGKNFPVQKKECVLHVKKRMFRRVKEAKKILTQNKKQKKATEVNATPAKKPKRSTSIGKPIKKAQLTNKLMSDLSVFYGLAIRRNPDSLENMRNEIWATYYHKISTEENPQHSYCPSGEESWCKWRKAEATGTLELFKHSPPLEEDIAEMLKPIYQELSSEALLERCLGNNTQNNNECFNSCVWNLVPKHSFVGRKVLEVATYTSACVFNEGFTSILKIMQVMGVTIGPAAQQLAQQHDDVRVSQANRFSSETSKESRTARREERIMLGNQYDEEEGIMYAPGIAD